MLFPLIWPFTVPVVTNEEKLLAPDVVKLPFA